MQVELVQTAATLVKMEPMVLMLKGSSFKFFVVKSFVLLSEPMGNSVLTPFFVGEVHRQTLVAWGRTLID